MKLLFIVAYLSFSGPAGALDATVAQRCSGDYLKHCSSTVPGTAACKQCFKRVGPALSAGCLKAIRNSAEFAGEYASRRRRYLALAQ